MGLFSRKCPLCGGPLQATGYSAPYPSYRCASCIERHRSQMEIKNLRDRVTELERGSLANKEGDKGQ